MNNVVRLPQGPASLPPALLLGARPVGSRAERRAPWLLKCPTAEGHQVLSHL